jgi:hypothetical protein
MSTPITDKAEEEGDDRCNAWACEDCEVQMNTFLVRSQIELTSAPM